MKKPTRLFSLCVMGASIGFVYAYSRALYGSRHGVLILLALMAVVLTVPLVKKSIREFRATHGALVILGVASFFVWTLVSVIFFDPGYLPGHSIVALLLITRHLASIGIFYAGFFAVALLLGDSILSRIYTSREKLSAYTFQAFAAGIFAIALYVYALSLISLVYPVFLVLPIVVALLNRGGSAYYRAKMHHIGTWWNERITLFSYEGLFWLSLMLITGLLILQTGWPWVVEGDSLALYFNLPDLILQHHAFVRFPFWPFGDSVFAFSGVYVPILLFGQHLLNYASLFFFLTGLPILFALTRRIWTRADSWLVLWLYITVPMFVGWFLLTPKIDTLVLLFVLAGVLLLHDVFFAHRSQTAGLAGLFIGFAVAVKFNTILLVPALILGMVLWWAVTTKAHRPAFTHAALLFCITGIIGFGLWGARTYQYHHNFFYPYSEGRFYDYLVTSPRERAYMDAFYRESDYHNANFGFNYGLVQNVSNYFTDALVHPSFNYGYIPILALLSIVIWKKTHHDERWYALVIGIVVVLWYITVRNEAHYMNFIMPFLALVGARAILSINRIARAVVIVAIGILIFFNMSSNTLLPGVFIAGATPVSALRIMPAYSLSEEVNAIIQRNPQAVFLTINAAAPHAVDNNLHRFDNVRNFYLALTLYEAATPQDAVTRMRRDGITHIIFGERIAEYVFSLCALRGAECPLYRDMVKKAEELRAVLHPVLTKGGLTIYEL